MYPLWKDINAVITFGLFTIVLLFVIIKVFCILKDSYNRLEYESDNKRTPKIRVKSAKTKPKIRKGVKNGSKNT